MKKLRIILVFLCLLIALSGCQTSTKTQTANEFVQQFITEFLTYKYDEKTEQREAYNQLSEKIEPYFTRDCYLFFTQQNYGVIPIQAAEKYQSDITVKDIHLEESFHEDKTVGYNVEVSLELPDEVATVNLTLSIREHHDTFEIYAIKFFKIDESLQ